MPTEVQFVVLGQASAREETTSNITILPTWTADLRLPQQIRRAIRRIRPHLLHVQHEFSLYGGLAQGGLMLAASMRERNFLEW